MDFDTLIDRAGTYSLKWDNTQNEPALPDILPFWVADMEFAAPPPVLEAISHRAGHPIFGYTRPDREYARLVAAWYATRQSLELNPDHILLAPGIMASIGAALHAFTEKGEGVIVMPPVYYPFYGIVADNDRVVLEAPLSRSGDSRWEMDFDRLERVVDEAAARGTKARAILVSSPHNPVGRVWSGPELAALLEFAHRRKLVLLSDEIHGDFVYEPGSFVSMARIEGADAAGVVVLSGPNKTFNLAGLHLNQIIVRDDAGRKAMARALSGWGFSQPNAFSFAAGIAAYRSGGSWLDELLAYLRVNREVLASFLSDRFPSARLSPTEGSYLAWIDFRLTISELGLRDDVELASLLESEGRVKVSAGSSFKTGGEGHLRFNFVCPRALLDEGLGRICAWLGSRAGKG
jgi:cystathionine beta-lyase